jgi:hypothetical protein
LTINHRIKQHGKTKNKKRSIPRTNLIIFENHEVFIKPHDIETVIRSYRITEGHEHTPYLPDEVPL